MRRKTVGPDCGSCPKGCLREKPPWGQERRAAARDPHPRSARRGRSPLGPAADSDALSASRSDARKGLIRGRLRDPVLEKHRVCRVCRDSSGLRHLGREDDTPVPFPTRRPLRRPPGCRGESGTSEELPEPTSRKAARKGSGHRETIKGDRSGLRQLSKGKGELEGGHLRTYSHSSPRPGSGLRSRLAGPRRLPADSQSEATWPRPGTLCRRNCRPRSFCERRSQRLRALPQGKHGRGRGRPTCGCREKAEKFAEEEEEDEDGRQGSSFGVGR